MEILKKFNQRNRRQVFQTLIKKEAFRNLSEMSKLLCSYLEQFRNRASYFMKNFIKRAKTAKTTVKKL
jgi:hypothetical protein